MSVMAVMELNLQTSLGLLAVLYMIRRSYARSSLTLDGILAAAFVGFIHAIHPFRLLPILLIFFLCGTKLTSWGADVKQQLLTEHEEAQNSKRESEPKVKKGRTAVQVFCNSLPATLLALCHLSLYGAGGHDALSISSSPRDLLILGVVAQYACSAADTFSSEIGILDDNWPLLITTLSKVPPGTNGGVTLLGLLAGLMGASIIGATSALFVPTQSLWTKVGLLGVSVMAGLCGTLLDSLLGATCQKTVYDTNMKKVIERHGGTSVAHGPHHDDRTKFIVIGHDLLDNNQVNLLSALITIVITWAVVFCVDLVVSLKN